MSADLTELTTFVYTPLAADEIRVLVPDASRTHDGLSWNLQKVSLTDEPDFDALSYTWASQADTLPITCNGCYFRVHHNLYAALPYLARRRKDGPVSLQPVWIDAVCINQADEGEKTAQINMMNSIYKKTQKVWVWLGIANQLHMKRIISLLPVIAAYNQDLARMSQDSYTVAMPVELQGLTTDYLESFVCLFRNSWYLPYWVIQEVALAQDITFLCGEHGIDFRSMFELICYDTFVFWPWRDINGTLSELGLEDFSANGTLYGSLLIVRLLFQSRPHLDDGSGLPLRILQLMSWGRERYAPHDRVFSMMGLLKEMGADD